MSTQPKCRQNQNSKILLLTKVKENNNHLPFPFPFFLSFLPLSFLIFEILKATTEQVRSKENTNYLFLLSSFSYYPPSFPPSSFILTLEMLKGSNIASMGHKH